jgi:TRAP-type C4-dicarboxylate transport system substrate-binding protein
MRLARRTFLASALVSVAAPAVLRVARADVPQFTFKLHHPFSSVSSGHDGFLAPWTRQIEAQSDGRIRIDIFPSMQLGGQPAQLFDQVRDGLADIVWALPRDMPGRFPKIEAFELPFVPSRRALVSSKAIEDYGRATLMDEFRDFHPICFSCSDRGVLHVSRPVNTLDDIKGLRLHVQTRFTGAAVHALGAHAVPMPSAQLPMAIAQHVVDGCVDPWDMAPALKLSDAFKAHTDFADLSLSTTTFVLAMNKSAYDRLPRDLKAVIDDNSGQHAAGMAGTMWDLAATAAADMAIQRGDTIATLLPASVAHWRAATEPVLDSWSRQMKEHRVDGGKLIANARTLLAKYADEPMPHQPRPQASAPADAEINPTAKIESPAAAPAAKSAPKPASAPAVKSAPTAAPAPPIAKPAPATASAVPMAPPAHAVAPSPPPRVKPRPAIKPPPKVLNIPL